MPVVIAGEEEYTGLEDKVDVLNYLEPNHKKLKLIMSEDMRLRRTRWVRNIVWHTTKGIKGKIKEGVGPDTNLENRIARLWATDGRNAGAHLSVDWNGTVGCHCDLLLHAAYHAGPINETSIGLELFQGSDGTLYDMQLQIAVELTTFLTARFGIQRQIPKPDKDDIIKRAKQGGDDLVGVFGHRNVSTNRGPGDPGNFIFERLKKEGYMVFSFGMEEDKRFWKKQQKALGLKQDGLPGPQTCDALRDAGYDDGIYTLEET